MAWEDIDVLYEPLPSVLVGIVGGFLCLNRYSYGLAIGWGQVIEQTVMKGTRYAWGPFVLAHLYRDLHEAVY